MIFRDDQEDGARWLASMRRAMLLDGPRVGKTAQAIGGCDILGAESVLVVCPSLARQNWAREFEACSVLGRPIATVMDARDPIEPHGVTILSMGGARNEQLHARVMEHRWDVLIIDEAHFLKDPKSIRTGQVCSKHGFASRAGHIWFLTGSPMLNSPTEMWVMLRTCGAYKDGLAAFRDEFCIWYEGEHGPVVKAMKNEERLQELMAPYMRRRTWAEISGADYVPPTWNDVMLRREDIEPDDLQQLLTIEAANKIGGRARALVERILAGEDVDLADARPKEAFARLRWANSWAKIGPIKRWIIPRLESGEIDKVVVFAHHGRVIELLQEYLRPYGAKSIYGGTKPKDRQSHIDLFNSRYDRRVLLVQDQVGQTAIDLSGACHLVFAELDWVPENNAQAMMRIQGPRQKRPVTIWNMVLEGFIDQVFTRVLRRKTEMCAKLFG